ncbi:class I poly(R)-hydroxyalkanoic acid synthase [Robbsia sp. KACC 23696]|uniref:class I poly(R)-hydroxyalkanoic acid synthase n=1 Tax=Robbsia sp. KACC 23696 TaxID=3149231 RepID=UPI00325B77B3
MSEPDRHTPHRPAPVRKTRASTATSASSQRTSRNASDTAAAQADTPRAANDADGADKANASPREAAPQRPDNTRRASAASWQAMQAQVLLWRDMLMAMARAHAPVVPPASLANLRQDYFTGWANGFRSASTTPSMSGAEPNAQPSPASGETKADTPGLSLAERFADHVHRINADTMRAMAQAVQGDADTTARLAFLVEQWIAATAPANVFGLNAVARAAMRDSSGASLHAGIGHLLDDLRRGKVTQSDPSAFEIGVSLAATPGAVVMETPLFQLLQYAPSGEHYERPLLIVPPCINKFYILDLQQRNSLVRYLCDAGHPVFLISWCNPDQSLAGATWDDYVRAVLYAMDAAAAIMGSAALDVMGFCIGGALLGCAAALDAGQCDEAGRLALRWSPPTDHPLAQALLPSSADGSRPAPARIASLSLLTTLLDYTDTGVLRLFVNDKQVAERERTIGDPSAPGLMTANEFGNTFSLLRPKELHWHYVQRNYMLGATPPAFDMLFWNGDGTHLPGPMFCWYLRQLYLDNGLREPGGLQVCGAPVDLRAITAPAFVYGSRDDHIVPWKSAYASLPLLGGPVSFVLGASGHIAGVVNPPAANKRGFWHIPGEAERGDTAPRSSIDAEQWLDRSRYETGSWWPTWSAWLAARQTGSRRPGKAQSALPRRRAGVTDKAERAGKDAHRAANDASLTRPPVREDTDPAWRYGSVAYPVIEAAPGRYVATPSARSA